MIEHPPSKIKIISAESTYTLRQKILRPGRPVSSCYFPNDFASHTTHFGAYRNTNLVGILSTYLVPVPEEYSAWQLRAMATLPWVRGMGYGQQLLQAAEEYINEQSGKIIWCNVRIHAVGFYQKAGFDVSGDRFFIQRVGEHILMKKTLFG